ncbi:MAG TPA: hypothetical protein VGO90_15425, partial [Chthoniobacteraceae bacterium]|nr:hypothetical protein [Chthoniobacteraceae bacterium]
GFDGRAVPGRISPLSVLLANPGNKPFEGELVLKQQGGLGAHSGAPYVLPVFLGPQSERWVQFYAFVNAGEEFELSWGRGAKDRYKLDYGTTAPPARVLLADPGNPFGVGAAMKTFPDNLFPTTVAATDGLDAVVLDYVPRWEAARRDAFLDWVKRGGIVMLLPGTGGEFPVFSGPLEVLNITEESANVGAGTVLRHKATRREASEKLLVDRGFPAPELKTGKDQVVIYNFEQTVFERLARLTRPDIRWWLINSLTVLYVLVVGPLHYRWSQRVDYRLSIAGLVGGVLLFGTAFAVIGRRGYGESQTVHSIAIARALGDGRCDVTQWVSAFATAGDIYTLTHSAPANLYAAVSPEPINGKILNGKDGAFLADIPLFSSRQFLHRAVLTGDDTRVTVEQWETVIGETVIDEPAKLKAIALRVNAQFPKETLELSIRHGDRFYRLKREGDLLVLADGGGQSFESFLPPQRINEASSGTVVTTFRAGSGATVSTRAELTPELIALAPLLHVRALGGRDYFQQQIKRPPLPPDRLELYVFTYSPESFRLQAEGFTNQNGCVLYVQDVSKP